MMNRRLFIAGFGVTAAWPAVARAQQGDYVRRIALMSNTDENDRNRVSQTVKIVEDELKKLGWVGRGKVEVDYYWHVNTVARGDEAVAKALKRSPDVIFVTNGQPLIAAKAATSTIPIVFTGISEPVGRGFVQSLAHPGGKYNRLHKYGADCWAKVARTAEGDGPSNCSSCRSV
jgi:putative tryptophan/tyrosine transport system substrate-binding protein